MVTAGHNRLRAIVGSTYDLLLVISTAFRRGERWAKFVAWKYPANIVGFAVVATVHDGWTESEETWALPTIAVLVGLGLVLPVRTFFGGASAQGRPAALARL